MARLFVLPVFLVLIALLIGLVFYVLRNQTSGLKIMLLGINITLLGGIVAADANSNLGGFEYLIVLLGFLVSVYGLSRNN